MFNIDRLTGIISLNRGDSAQLSLFINAGDELNPLQFAMTDSDNIYLAIEEPNQPFEKAIVKKVINNRNSIKDKDGNFIIELEPKDTECLMPGLYYYEIKLRQLRENYYRNLYDIIVFNNDHTYYILDEEHNEVLERGTWELAQDNLNVYYLTNYQGQTNIARLTDNILNYKNMNYKRENNLVSTIIPQTKFIIER